MRARTVSFIELSSFYLREKLPFLEKRISAFTYYDCDLIVNVKNVSRFDGSASPFCIATERFYFAPLTKMSALNWRRSPGAQL